MIALRFIRTANILRIPVQNELLQIYDVAHYFDLLLLFLPYRSYIFKFVAITYSHNKEKHMCIISAQNKVVQVI